MAARQQVRASHARPSAGEAVHAAGSLLRKADGPARTAIAPPQAADPYATLAIDRWNNEGGRIYEGRQISNGAAQAPRATRGCAQACHT
jgi:hypothetical protein